ncbi:pectinesterase inhibitor 10-like [Astatotilapia calliptera]|uniref:pectinesterase inhibitor 10-like n=1 Tax=Astatotilapia calliptera TaxID=8154 RepID=UPI000E4103F2|nr:pectinesterase inhibitor 10-like [Astatotilapia calliptera]
MLSWDIDDGTVSNNVPATSPGFTEVKTGLIYKKVQNREAKSKEARRSTREVTAQKSSLAVPGAGRVEDGGSRAGPKAGCVEDGGGSRAGPEAGRVEDGPGEAEADAGPGDVEGNAELQLASAEPEGNLSSRSSSPLGVQGNLSSRASSPLVAQVSPASTSLSPLEAAPTPSPASALPSTSPGPASASASPGPSSTRPASGPALLPPPSSTQPAFGPALLPPSSTRPAPGTAKLDFCAVTSRVDLLTSLDFASLF